MNIDDKVKSLQAYFNEQKEKRSDWNLSDGCVILMGYTPKDRIYPFTAKFDNWMSIVARREEIANCIEFPVLIYFCGEDNSQICFSDIGYFITETALIKKLISIPNKNNS